MTSSDLGGWGVSRGREDRGDAAHTLQAWQEQVNDLVLLDWEGSEVDFLDGLYLSIADQTSELGHWDPLVCERVSMICTN